MRASLGAVLLAMAVLAAGCDHGPSGPAPSECDQWASGPDECPDGNLLCAGVCGAHYECCYPEGDQWRVWYYDCNPCPDAAVDAPRPVDAGADGPGDASTDGVGADAP